MPHQIDHLTIRAFRQLVDVELEQLGRVNLLVGANNSGKTTVLEAVAAYCNPLDPLAWLLIARQREIKSSREPVLDGLRWLFPRAGENPQDAYFQGEVRIAGSGRFRNVESGAEFSGVERDEDELGSIGYDDESDDSTGSIGDDDESDTSSSSFGNNEDRYEGSQAFQQPELGAEVRLFADILCEGSLDGQTTMQEERFRVWQDERFVSRSAPSEIRLPVEAVSPFSHRVEQAPVRLLTSAVFAEKKPALLRLIQLLDPEVQDLEILSREGIRPTVFVAHRRSGYTPLSVLGDGVRRALTMGLNLVAAENGVLLIDEIETAIHKEALERVFDWLVQACAEHNVQLFATTHSLEAVDAILGSKQIDLGELNTYRLESGDRDIAVKHCSGDLLHRLRHEHALDVR